MKKRFTSSLVSLITSGKKATLSLFLFFIIASFLATFALGQLKECGEGDDSCKIDNAYSCLQESIDTKTCARMGSDEKVFSLIAAKECKSEVMSDSKFQTDIKYTALAFLGGADSNGTQNWLISKNRTTDNVDWFLQIDTAEAGELKCDVKSGSSTQSVTFNEDKTIKTSNTGGCISGNTGDYWLKISSSCFNKDLKVSCGNSFTTNLLYQKIGDPTIYVSEETHSSSSSGETTERVQSLCFGTTSGCNYEGSLWASLILNSQNYDISPYLPYLITNKDTNSKFLPEAFFYLFLKNPGQFGNELLSKQKSDKWWQEGATNDKFYDTALALYAFQYDDSLQKQNSVAWLLDEAQEENGCWSNANNVIRNTAFLLYAIEPRSSFGRNGDDTDIINGTNNGTNEDCEDAGNYCMSGISCSQAGGNRINSLSCSGTFVCCDKPRLVETCVEQEGEICTSSQECVGGSEAQASDLRSDEICCISGTCETSSGGEEEQEKSQCEIAKGTCVFGTSCQEGETESSASCEFSSDICCIKKTGLGISAFWIWVLVILIILSGFGIIFREKLKHLLFRMKHGFSGGGASNYSRRGPPFNPPAIFPRRMVPTQPQHHPANIPQHHAQKHGELSDVLKKLKEMGK